MTYKLIVTKHADELLDSALRYLIYQLKNEQAAVHLSYTILFFIEANSVIIAGIFHQLENYWKKL